MRQLLQRCLSLAAAACLMFTACSAPGGGNAPLAGGDGQTNQPGPSSQAMGRYIEEELTLPEGAVNLYSIARRPDGRLEAIYNQSAIMTGPWLMAHSDDGGKTWTTQTPDWLAQLEETTLYAVGYGEDGSTVLRYQSSPREVIQAMMDGALTEEPDLGPIMEVLVTPDGQATTREANVGESQHYISGEILLTASGEVVAVNFNQLQHIASDNRLKNSFVTQQDRGSIAAIGNTLYALDGNAIQTYDLETGRQGEPIQLAAPQGEGEDSGSVSHVTVGDGVLGDGAKLIAAQDGQSLYYCDSTGLYRQPLGGSVGEKLMDGQLTSLNMPSMRIHRLVQLSPEEFVVALSTDNGDKLMRYHYSAQVPTVPETQLTVYSLEDNKTVRQAMGLFQRQNPNVQVRYQVASEAGTSTSDQLRTLSTQLLAGEGPDVLLLDGMPIASYQEKGVLADLNTLLGDTVSQLLPNIRSAYQQGETLPAVAARFSVPVLYTARQEALQADDLVELLDAFAQLRASDPRWGKDAFLLPSENAQALIRFLYPAAAPAWFEEDGSLDREALGSFLSAVQGVSNPETEYLPEMADYLFSQWDSLSYAYRMLEAGMTNLDSFVALAYLQSAIQQRGEGQVRMLPGQEEPVLIPRTILGINANSQQQQTAAAFVKTLLSDTVLQNDFQDGLPSTQSAFLQASKQPYADYDDAGSIGSTDGATGETITLVAHWPTQQQLDQVMEQIQSISKASTVDQTVLDTLVEESAPYFDGSRDLESTLDAVQQKVDLYLSE